MNIAIVTGASSGMGREFVLQLNQYVQVDEIWAIARRTEALESLKAACSVPVRPISMDLGQCSSFDALKELLEAEKPNVRLLVNAAGFGKFGSYRYIDVEDECRMIELNCTALVRMTRLVLPFMAAGSHILQLDSLSAFQPVPYLNTYAATKHFVLAYSRALNQELKGTGIRCMSMNPGWVKTEFFNHAFQTNEASEVQYFNHLYEAKDCVATGLKDLYKTRKDYSVHGLPIKAQVKLVKFLPHNLVMWMWRQQQKHPKNNVGLTTGKS